MRAISQFCLIVTLSGCGWQTDEEALAMPGRQPAAAMASARAVVPLDDLLATLEEEIDRALAAEVPAEADAALLRAEAITDRLMEARLPFRWIRDERYILDARLRQIQSTADRAVAGLMSGMPREQVQADVQHLRHEVRSLRQSMAAGGGPPRPPVADLIEALDTLRTPQLPEPEAPAAAGAPGGPGVP
jgi:hypothetical protein